MIKLNIFLGNIMDRILGSDEYLVEIRNLGKVYRQGDVKILALKGINLTVEKQKFTFLVGPSGSGKTTLLNIMGCVDAPSNGDLSILGHNVVSLNDSQLADFRSKHLGYIFQNFNLIPVLSAYENVEYPLIMQKISAKERKERVMEILDAVGLAKRYTHTPSQLSGGEQQRVAIARALVKQPAMVLADEPTANLDSKTSEEIIQLMLKMQEKYKTGFIFSTHDTSVMHHADKIIEIKDGSLASDLKFAGTA